MEQKITGIDVGEFVNRTFENENLIKLDGLKSHSRFTLKGAAVAE